MYKLWFSIIRTLFIKNLQNNSFLTYIDLHVYTAFLLYDTSLITNSGARYQWVKLHSKERSIAFYRLHSMSNKSLGFSFHFFISCHFFLSHIYEQHAIWSMAQHLAVCQKRAITWHTARWTQDVRDSLRTPIELSPWTLQRAGLLRPDRLDCFLNVWWTLTQWDPCNKRIDI